ncbi:cell division FtsA domain-containing protein [Athalassotoga sp.]|uniref:cell division FtsA domain-containing protein n=1 Tax=Athalassotoga sp. TaxID=2022597 RepID=UPI003D00743E
MIFGLDIGTRTVVGILAEEIENGINVVDFEVAEHEERAMLDGQINDVPKVSSAVLRVKKALEERNNVELMEASTAVAGRFLKTITGTAVDRIPFSKIDENYLKSLEFKALSDAIEKNQGGRDYCVGYSVLRYTVDGEDVRNLIGQFGETASVSVIAAFLPQRIVEALFSVMELSHLTVNYLTLEPMAAMNLVVPADLRRLNLALVDVGAGTSDIAISNNGAITSYGMIPMAGDEITEKICDEFLLSFQDGEKVKRSLDLEKINVENVLGIPIEITKEECLKVTDSVVNVITEEISKAIIDINGKAPAAVMIVGGGAKVPHFVDMLAEKLSLPKTRIALRNVENISFIKDQTKKLKGSEFITPVGILYSSRFNLGKIFKRITLNGQPVQIMNLTGREDVLQTLIQGGFDVKKMIGSPSNGITYTLNGEVRIVSGELPDPVVKINGKIESLKSTVKDGDIIEIKPSDGHHKVLKVSDIVKPLRIKIDGKEIELLPRVKINSKDASLEDVINDGDKVEVKKDLTVGDLFEFLHFTLDGLKVFVNGKIVDSGTILKEDDEVRVEI